ncbi:MAG: adenosine deaminase [Lachnospiraceae bacterium]|nr:adenosine deaminase [Lachnospiraceae bacterium]
MKKQIDYNFIKLLPKIDLHCHLDGSLPVNFVYDTLQCDIPIQALEKKLSVPVNCNSLAEYLTCFDLPIKCLNNKENITNSVIKTLEACAQDNIKYIELRFAPGLSETPDLSLDDIIDASIKGCHEGKKLYNIDSNIIICAMRHHDEDTNLRVLHSALNFLNEGVCALDLAGNEAAFDNHLFINLFNTAKHSNMPFTIHSGECGNVENIKLALELGAKRIGHGIAMMKDVELMKQCAKERIGIELCPTSNYQTKAISEDADYPLNLFIKNGILATINTDNRTVSNTTISNEFEFIYNKFGIREEDFITLTKNSIEISFANDNIKNYLYYELKRI